MRTFLQFKINKKNERLGYVKIKVVLRGKKVIFKVKMRVSPQEMNVSQRNTLSHFPNEDIYRKINTANWHHLICSSVINGEVLMTVIKLKRHVIRVGITVVFIYKIQHVQIS